LYTSAKVLDLHHGWLHRLIFWGGKSGQQRAPYSSKGRATKRGRTDSAKEICTADGLYGHR